MKARQELLVTRAGGAFEQSDFAKTEELAVPAMRYEEQVPVALISGSNTTGLLARPLPARLAGASDRRWAYHLIHLPGEQAAVRAIWVRTRRLPR